MLPRVKIFFENGALGQIAPLADGVYGLLCTGAAVSTTFALATPYILRSYDSLATLGINETNNPSLVKIVTDFYNEAGAGTELWIMAFPDTVKMSDMVSPTDVTKAKALINAANGRLRGLIVSRKPAVGYVPTIADGLDEDVALARTNAQILAEWSTNSKYAPIFVLIEGYAYNGNAIDLTDLTIGTDNRVAVFIGDTVNNSPTAAVGLPAGRLALNPVQVNIGRVKDGTIATNTAFIKDKSVETADVESIHNKGYITMRTYVGRSGYYFNDDFTATLPTDDYSHLTARRTIDKAYRIAYDTLLNELLDNVPVNNDGTIQAPFAKSIQGQVENAIALSMTANGELSTDPSNPSDRGVQCLVDLSQNIVSTSKMVVKLRVKPFGYPRYIDVYLGFQAVVTS